MTDKQVRMVPDDELAAMIQQADDGFGYSMEMVRLVDGVRTYRLKIAGQETVEITDCEDNDYEASQACYRLISAAKNKVRADAIRTILAAAPSVQPDREAVARVIAADLLRQDYEPGAQPDTVTFSQGLSWSYIDQGWVDFGEIADRVIAYFAALTVQKEEG